MPDIQSLFIVVVILLLGGLLVDGAVTGAVWVKGARYGPFSFRHWAHKRGRGEDPWSYWFAMSFYGLALFCLGGYSRFG